MAPLSPVFVVGRFPPPLDGQTLATQRLAQLLEGQRSVVTLNTEPDDGVEASDTKFRASRVWHYGRLRSRLKTALAEPSNAPVVWTSISPTSLGHWRDLLTTVPAIGSGHPLIAVSHRANLDELFASPLLQRTAASIERRVTHFVFLTEAISQRCAAWIPADKRSVIPNTVDDLVLCSKEDVVARRRTDRPLSVLFLSNMLPEKGYMDVLAALRLAETETRARFVGAWPTERARRDFESQIALSGLEGKSVVAGPVHDRTAVKQLMLDSDVLVLPTFHPTEGMPITILEALNAGTPVIATRTGGIAEVLEDGVSGLFVSPNAPAEIAAAIQKVALPSSWHHLSAGARQRFDANYHPDVIRRRWSALLARLSA